MTLRRLLTGAALAAALVITPLAPATAAPLSAAPVATASVKLVPSAKVVKFPNCAALNRVYPAGVAKPGVKFNIANGKKKALRVKPKYSKELYAANSKMDRDKDGIACEK